MAEAIIKNTYELENAFKAIRRRAVEILENGNACLSIIKAESYYSKKQRGASHVWFKLCAEYLNDSGFTRKGKSKITGELIELPWTDTAFKAFYKDVLYEYNSMLSTEDQKSGTPSEVREIIHRYFAGRGGCLPDWPSAR